MKLSDLLGMKASDLNARAVERLERAADYLRWNGHCKGRRFMLRDDGAVSACVMGVLSRFTHQGEELEWMGIDADGWRALDALAEHLGLSNADGIVNWNDHPDRTAEEVVEALLATAKKLRNGEPLCPGTHP